MDPGSGKSVTEKGMVSQVVKDLTLPFSGSNHVLYMDTFFNSGPLVGLLKTRFLWLVLSKKGL